MKTCTICKQEKPLEEFALRATGAGRRPHCWCRPCAKEYKRRWDAEHPHYYKGRPHKKNPESLRRAKIKHRYGLTTEEYEYLRSFPCQICGETSEVIDHDHDTGRVRGPLCDLCNKGLGCFKDDWTRVASAAKYLAPHEA